MSSEAKATGTEGLGFDGDVEAAERALETRDVQDNNGTAGDLATPRLLPVQQVPLLVLLLAGAVLLCASLLLLLPLYLLHTLY